MFYLQIIIHVDIYYCLFDRKLELIDEILFCQQILLLNFTFPFSSKFCIFLTLISYHLPF